MFFLCSPAGWDQARFRARSGQYKPGSWAISRTFGGFVSESGSALEERQTLYNSRNPFAQS